MDSEKNKPKGAKSHNSPLLTAIIAGTIALLSNTILTYLNGNNQIKLEEKKFETQLILSAVSGDSIPENREKLKFLLYMGLITDEDSILHRALADTSFKPVFEGKTLNLSSEELKAIMETEANFMDFKKQLK